jgi:hypothetical protein
MIEKFHEYNVPAYFCFLDYTKAFDTVEWEHLWYILREMGTPEYLVCFIYNLYIANRSYVRIEDTLSYHFKVSKGVRQGCVMLPVLFNIYEEWIIRKATEGWEGGVVTGGRQILNLRYADDTTLMAKTEEEIANLLQCIEKISGEVGLKLNRSKCLLKVDRAGVYPENPMYTTDIQMKSEVIYLGARISNKGDSMGEIKRRISIAKEVIMKLTKFWKDHNIIKVTKVRLIHILVFPVVMY